MFSNIMKNMKTYFSNGPKVVFVILLVCMCTFIGIWGSKKDISIVIDGHEINVTTYRSSVDDILKKNNITLGPKDTIKPSLNSKIKSGDTIKVKRAINVNLSVDGKTQSILTTANNVGQLLEEEGIKLSKEDRILPSKKEDIKNGLEIAVTRVNTKIEKKVKAIEFTTEVKKDDTLNQGRRKVIKEGTTGQKEINEKVVYENGKEVSREVVKEKVIKKPVNKIIALGTMKTLSLSRGGNLKYSNKYRMRATAYTASYNDTGKRPGDRGFGITASGTRVKRHTNGGYSTVAVDPKVIPLGTKLYVDGYGYATAEDTGGAIKGNKIDLYFDNSSQVYRWGVRYVDVYVLNYSAFALIFFNS